MLIRLMVETDYDAVYALWQRTPGMAKSDFDDTREAITRYLRRNPTTSFVAESQGEIVGVILCGHDGRRGFIYHMAVDTVARRQGIGRELLAHALVALKAEGIRKAALLVFATNEIGNAFWEEQGFAAREDIRYRNLDLTDTPSNGCSC